MSVISKYWRIKKTFYLHTLDHPWKYAYTNTHMSMAVRIGVYAIVAPKFIGVVLISFAVKIMGINGFSLWKYVAMYVHDIVFVYKSSLS